MQRAMSRISLLCLLALAVAFTGCPTETPDDAGRDVGVTDAPTTDTPRDATPMADVPTDTNGTDVPVMDDAGTDAPVTACSGITELRALTPGTVSQALTSVIVTYVRPAIGADPAGFFVQCSATGPAVFVAVDPTTLTPAPAAGDQVSFTATTIANAAGTAGTGSQFRVTALSDYSRSATATPLTGLVQDLSAATDVVSALGSYESELVTITGTVSEDFVSAGEPHRRARLVTAGLDDAGLVARLPDTIITSLSIRVGCVLTIGPSPLWRFDGSAQVMGYDEADVTVVSCPAVPVVAAGAIAITEIGFTFAGSDDDLEFIELLNTTGAAIDLSGCVLTDAGSSVLTLSGLTVAANDRAVVGGTASESTADAVLPSGFGLGGDDAITLTCGTVVVDTVDWGAAPFPTGTDDVSMQLSPTASTATANDDGANWCLTPTGNTYGTMDRLGTPGLVNPACPVIAAGAEVRINEVNANISGGCDLVELRVISGGSLAGFQVRQHDGAIVTFPAGFMVATNDLIVVHATGMSATCNGGGTTVPADETSAPNAVPASSVSSNFDGAFDFYSADGGITASTNVITVVDPTSVIIDAVLLADAATGTAAVSQEAAAATVAAAGEWTTPAGTVPAGGFVDDDFRANAVLDLNGTGTAAAGESIRRTDNLDTDHTGGWAQGASTFGAINAGQTAL
jgi:hypothetical protein